MSNDSIDSLRQHLDSRLDRFENKLDDHLGRISKAEESIVWLRGHVKLATAVFIAASGTLFAWYFGGQ